MSKNYDMTRREYAEGVARQTFPKSTASRSLFAKLLDRELSRAGYNEKGVSRGR